MEKLILFLAILYGIMAVLFIAMIIIYIAGELNEKK